MYKYDTHVHTDETSSCAKVQARDAVRMYKEAGYKGIVITDHYAKRFFEKSPGCSWSEKIDDFLKGYRIALDEGEKIGLTVMLGIEIRFTENPNDYLVFGLDEKFLKENKELYYLGLAKFRKFIEGQGVLIYQAHPFRNKMERADPKLLDGVEVFNGHPRHESNNHLALEFAKSNNLKMLSGSDFHQVDDVARGGIFSENEIKSIKDLVNLLSESGAVRLIINQ